MSRSTCTQAQIIAAVKQVESGRKVEEVARADVEHIRTTFAGMSERHACGLALMRCRAVAISHAERPAMPAYANNDHFAQQHPRHGYRSLWVLVRWGGETANHKRVHRLYRDAGLSLRRKKRKHLVRQWVVFPKVKVSNEEWALDFATDAMASHRHLRILSVVDVFTRECLALEPHTSLGRVRVIGVLEQIIDERGATRRIRTDNGPGFTSRCFIAWCLDRRIELVNIRPGEPVENAYVESFRRQLREECLQVSWFRNLFDARRQSETWRGHYNRDRPHSSRKAPIVTPEWRRATRIQARRRAFTQSPAGHAPMPLRRELPPNVDPT